MISRWPTEPRSWSSTIARSYTLEVMHLLNPSVLRRFMVAESEEEVAPPTAKASRSIPDAGLWRTLPEGGKRTSATTSPTPPRGWAGVPYLNATQAVTSNVMIAAI